MLLVGNKKMCCDLTDGFIHFLRLQHVFYVLLLYVYIVLEAQQSMFLNLLSSLGLYSCIVYIFCFVCSNCSENYKRQIIIIIIITVVAVSDVRAALTTFLILPGIQAALYLHCAEFCCIIYGK